MKSALRFLFVQRYREAWQYLHSRKRLSSLTDPQSPFSDAQKADAVLQVAKFLGIVLFPTTKVSACIGDCGVFRELGAQRGKHLFASFVDIVLARMPTLPLEAPKTRENLSKTRLFLLLPSNQLPCKRRVTSFPRLEAFDTSTFEIILRAMSGEVQNRVSHASEPRNAAFWTAFRTIGPTFLGTSPLRRSFAPCFKLFLSVCSKTYLGSLKIRPFRRRPAARRAFKYSSCRKRVRSTRTPDACISATLIFFSFMIWTPVKPG